MAAGSADTKNEGGGTGGGFAGSVLVLTSGTIVSRVVLLISLPVISRLFTPEQVGLWQLYVSLFLLVQPYITGEYARAVVLAESDDAATDVFTTALAATLVSCLLLLLAAVFARRPVSGLIGAPSLAPFFWFLPLVALGLGLEQTCLHWLMRRDRYLPASGAVLLRTGLVVGVPLVLATLGRADEAGLIYGSLAGYTAAGLFLLAVVYKSSGPPPPARLSLKGAAWAARKYKNFPLYVAPYGMIWEADSRLRLFILGALASSRVVGLVALAQQIVRAPLFLTGDIRTVFYARAGRSKDRDALGEFVNRLLRLMVLASTPGFIFFILNAQALLTLLLGDDWSVIGPYAALLALPAYLLFNVSWLDRMYDVTLRQRLAVVMKIGYDVIGFGLFVLVLLIRKSAFEAVAVWSVLYFLYESVWVVVTYRISGFSTAPLSGLAARALALAAATGLLHLALAGLAGRGWGLALEAVALFAYYTFFYFRLWKPEKTLFTG